MPDVDLAAIRSAVRTVVAQVRALPVDCTALTGPVWYGDGWKQALDTVEEYADAWPDDGDDVGALAAELARTVSELRALADRLREVTAERDALLAGDCPVDGCGGGRYELQRAGVEAPIVRMSCGHDDPEAVSAPESPAEPEPQPAP